MNTTSKKTLISYWVIMFFVALISTLLTFKLLTDTKREINETLDKQYNCTMAGRMMLETLEGTNNGLFMIISGHWKEGREKLETQDSLFMQGLKLAYLSCHNYEEPYALLQSIERQFSSLRNMWLRPIIGDIEEAGYQWYTHTYLNSHVHLKDFLYQFTYLTESDLFRTVERLNKQLVFLLIPYISCLLIMLTLSILIGIRILSGLKGIHHRT